MTEINHKITFIENYFIQYYIPPVKKENYVAYYHLHIIILSVFYIVYYIY